MTGFGERVAAQEGYRDGTEDERFRAVVLFLSSSPVPPMPPSDPHGDPPVNIDSSSPGSVLDSVGKVLDVVSGVGGPLALLLDGLVAGVVVDTLGTAAGVAGAILAVPLAWNQGDRLAGWNANRRAIGSPCKIWRDSIRILHWIVAPNRRGRL